MDNILNISSIPEAINDPNKIDGKIWLKYGGVILLGLSFLIFLAILIFSSLSVGLFNECVGIIEITDEITTRGTPDSIFMEGIPGSEDISATMEKINARDDIGAVVIVIESPGGSVVASHEIYQAIKNLKKPKVAYLREIATSGGYYISTGADYIISEPNAITGSIGAIMVLSDMSGLFEKIGYNMTVIKSGELKDIGSPSRHLTEKEQQVLQTLINEIFADFKSIILENRGTRLDKERFNEILDARIVSGRQAKEIGLVDALGNKKDAVKKAAELANITSKEPNLCYISTSGKSTSIFDMRAFISALHNTIQDGIGHNIKKVNVRYE